MEVHAETDMEALQEVKRDRREKEMQAIQFKQRDLTEEET